MDEPNILLDALIEEAGMSHAGLAGRINTRAAQQGLGLRYDHTAVARWIRDHAIPRGNVPDLICEVLGPRVGRVLTLADIGMDPVIHQCAERPLSAVVDRATALWRCETKRHAYFQSTTPITGISAVAPVFEWENPPEDSDVSRVTGTRVGDGDVGVLVIARERYEDMYRMVGGIAVRPRMTWFLNTHVAPRVKGSYDDSTGRRLFRVVGSLVALAGVAAYDSDLQGLAQRYFYDALRMAKASGDRGLGGYVIALLTNQAIYLENWRQAIQFAEAGLRSQQFLTPALITDLYAMQAKAYARIRDRAASHRQMNAAETMAGRICRDNEPPETGYVQEGLVECQQAEALYSLGDLKAACAYAEGAVSLSRDTHVRGRMHRLATLTNVLIAGADPDQAVSTATRMLDLAGGSESCRIRDRLHSIRASLKPYTKTRDVRDVCDRIDRMLNVPV